jgi:hypothetical protein
VEEKAVAWVDGCCIRVLELRHHSENQAVLSMRSVCLRASTEAACLLMWKNERDGEIKEAVRLARCVGALDGYVELKRITKEGYPPDLSRSRFPNFRMFSVPSLKFWGDIYSE